MDTRNAVGQAPRAQARVVAQGESGRDLVCFSHLRWDFVYQRPQHLLSRAARDRQVFVFEEPVDSDREPGVDITHSADGVHVVVPHLPAGLDPHEREALLAQFVDRVLAGAGLTDYVAWYYTPNWLPPTRHLHPAVTVYDCMDELSMFKGADGRLRDLEAELLERADVVFAGGPSLYEAKRDRHPNVYLFSSSIDRAHFAQARLPQPDPAGQAQIPHPRLGFFGVVDERMDMDLLAGVAAARPDWHLVIVGPLAKISPEDLPQAPNLHYLGGKRYADLPAYLAGWDVALLPFARNDATRFISPTKTPEYLAGGKPVVSTGIRDVVRPYGEQGLVRIADTVEDFVGAVEAALAEDKGTQEAWLARVDAFLQHNSWDSTWQHMDELVQACAEAQPG